MTQTVCIGGITGWVGHALSASIEAAEDLTLVAGVSRQAAGSSHAGAPIHGDVVSALRARPCEVYVDYTHPSVAKRNILAALDAGAAVVVGTSGLSGADYDEIAAKAAARKLGVIASGNFSITAALLQHFAMIAARHVPNVEIIDYAKASKPDAPSGTARELAERLGRIAPDRPGFPVEQTIGSPDVRGGTIAGSRVHAIRLPSFVLSIEAIFGAPSERLILRHDAGEAAAPYIAGTLLAIRRVAAVKGLVRGLDTLLFSEDATAG
ncbi:MAG TPA: dihydrodipicolinate reductase C-terminal domain-containing protein [Dongiaceae bacterium]|jgi:4-hydroxy-tetrahydrodipicolinate reductase|nr:dihydrodipicolinate reductase C-terminal domain-containing protein [Dongiaceae bacterium]